MRSCFRLAILAGISVKSFSASTRVSMSGSSQTESGMRPRCFFQRFTFTVELGRIRSLIEIQWQEAECSSIRRWLLSTYRGLERNSYDDVEHKRRAQRNYEAYYPLYHG